MATVVFRQHKQLDCCRSSPHRYHCYWENPHQLYSGTYHIWVGKEPRGVPWHLWQLRCAYDHVWAQFKNQQVRQAHLLKWSGTAGMATGLLGPWTATEEFPAVRAVLNPLWLWDFLSCFTSFQMYDSEGNITKYCHAGRSRCRKQCLPLKIPCSGEISHRHASLYEIVGFLLCSIPGSASHIPLLCIVDRLVAQNK